MKIKKLFLAMALTTTMAHTMENEEKDCSGEILRFSAIAGAFGGGIISAGCLYCISHNSTCTIGQSPYIVLGLFSPVIIPASSLVGMALGLPVVGAYQLARYYRNRSHQYQRI